MSHGNGIWPSQILHFGGKSQTNQVHILYLDGGICHEKYARSREVLYYLYRMAKEASLRSKHWSRALKRAS